MAIPYWETPETLQRQLFEAKALIAQLVEALEFSAKCCHADSCGGITKLPECTEFYCLERKELIQKAREMKNG